MPTYEYECTACSTRFERQQRMSDPPVSECPDCGARVRKVFQAFAMAVKGGGAAPQATPPCATGG